MKTLKLTNEELETLILLYEGNPCSSTCVIPEYRDKEFDCDNCPFEQNKWSIWEKLMELDCKDDPAYK